MINNSSTLIHCICERFSAKKDVAAAFVWLHYRLEEGQECSTQKINSYFEQANLPKYNVNAARKSKVDDNTAKMQSIKQLGV